MKKKFAHYLFFAVVFLILLTTGTVLATDTATPEYPIDPAYIVVYPELGSGVCGENARWTFYSDGRLVISGEGPMYDYMTKTVVGEAASYVQCRDKDYRTFATQIKTIVVEDGITYIGIDAFSQLRVETVTLGKDVAVIGDQAFSFCGRLKSVTLPQNLTVIEDYAFDYCSSLKELALPEGLRFIGMGAFNGTALTEITLPDSLTTLETGAFSWCTALEEAVMGNGLSALPSNTFYYSNALSSVNLGSITSVGERAFQGCTSLTTVTAPRGFTAIDNYAFYGCTALPKLVLPSNLQTIGVYAFGNCTGLTSVSAGSQLAAISDYGFWGCTGLQSVTFAADGVSVGKYAFEGCSALRTVSAPAGLGSVGDYAFEDCDSLTAVSIVEGTVGQAAFHNLPKLRTVTCGPEVTGIGAGAFNSCTGLLEVTVAAGALGNNAFDSCPALKTVTLGEGVTALGDYAFRENISLQSIVIPDSVQSIGILAFEGCTALTTAVVGDGCTTLDSAFYNCSALTRVTVGNGVTTVGMNAFTNCTALTQVQFGTGLAELDSGAFEDSPDLQLLLFKGDAPEVMGWFNNPRCQVLFVEGKEGWTTPTWNAFPSRAVEKSYFIDDLFEKGYYGKAKTYRFSFKNEKGSGLDQVTLSVNGMTYSSGESTSLSAKLSQLDPKDELLFTREGYGTVTIPAGLLDTFTTVRFSPAGSGEPRLQMMFAGTDGEHYTDLTRRTLYLTEGSLLESVEFYVHVDWGGQPAGSIYLSQSGAVEDAFLLENGWNEAKNYSKNLKKGSGMYLLMVCGDGTIHRERLSISVRKSTASTIKLDMGPSFDIPTPDLEFFREFKFSMDLLKDIKLSVTVEADGTVLGVLGMEASEQKYVKPIVESMQDGFDLLNMQSSAKAYATLENILTSMEKSGQILPVIPKYGSFGVASQFQAVGYLKGKAVPDRSGSYSVEITECKLGLMVKGSVSRTWQTVVAYVPVYFEAGLEGSAAITTRLYDNGSFSALVIGSTELTNKLELKIGAGLGLNDIAAVGVEGAGELSSKLILPTTPETVLDDYKLWGNFSVTLKAKVFCFESDVQLVQTEDYYLYPREANKKLSALSLALGSETQWHAQSRDYLYTFTTLDSGSGDTAASNQYTYADVAMEVLDDGTRVMVWTADPGTRPEANNRTILYYACDNGSGWSAPAPVEVTDDGTGDFAPQLKILNDQLWLFWQDASRAILDTDTYMTTAEQMDIACAVFDSKTGTFTPMGTVGTEWYDGTVSATTVDGKPAVIWTSDSRSDLFATDGNTTSLHRAVWDGSTWNTEILAQELGCVDHTAADGTEVWFSALAPDGDREIFRYSETVQQITDNDVLDSKPQITAAGALWYSAGQLVTQTDTIPLAAVTDRFQYVRSDSGLEAVVYAITDNSSNLSAIYANFCDTLGWGQPVRLDDGSGNIGSFRAAFCPDGKLAVAVTERSASDGILSAGAQIKVYTAVPSCDLVLTQVDYQAHTLVQGEHLALTLTLHNAGMTDVDLLQVLVKDGETVIADQIYAAELRSGCQDVMTAALLLPDTLSDELTVTVSPFATSDSNPDNNTLMLALRTADISLEETEARYDGSVTTVTVLAANRGWTPLKDVVISLTDEQGNPLAQQNLSTLSAGDSTFVEFILTDALEENATVTLSASGPATENLYANNTAQAIVEYPEVLSAQEIRLTAGYTISEEILTAGAFVENATETDRIYTLLFAAYDANGKMLEIRQLSGQAAAGSEADEQVSFLTAADEIVIVRAFLLDASNAPLTERVSIWID